MRFFTLALNSRRSVMGNFSYMEMRKEMVATARLIWERRLTNASGGNFAVRVEENRVLISP